jgi:hypothetical protein
MQVSTYLDIVRVRKKKAFFLRECIYGCSCFSVVFSSALEAVGSTETTTASRIGT